MQNSYEILELFPIPVYTTMIPDKLSSAITFFDQQELNEGNDNDNYGYRSKDSYILDKPECKDLSSFILSNVKTFANTLGYDYKDFRFGQSWISIKAPGQHHTGHTHPNSLISGVFYYGQGEINTPSLKFHKNIGGVNAAYIQPKIVVNKKDIKYAQQEFLVEFVPGLLILFPSYLMHSVPINKTNKARYSLAFNVVPEVGFGDEMNLTELLFKNDQDASNIHTKKKKSR